MIASFEGKPEIVTWGSSPDNDLVVKHIDKKR